MYLKDFTQNIVPFLEGQSLDRFILELNKVPNCQERFQNLIDNDYSWLETTLNTRDENGLHIYFFFEEIKIKEIDVKPNQLFLRNFCLGTQPTLKVEIYKH